MRVLVTDGAMNKSLAVVRSIADRADHVGVSSRFPVSVAGVSRHADERHWIRNRDPESYVDRLNEIAAAGEYDQLLPVGGKTFEIASKYRDRLQLPVERFLPSRESMAVALTKRRTYDLSEQVGVPTPTTVSVPDGAELPSAGERVGYPAVLKTGNETGSRFVRVVESDAELRAAYEEYRRDRAVDPIVQEYLPGIGRGYFALYLEGELVGGYAHRRIREYPPEGGASACAESEQDDELEEYATRVLDALNWHGVAMVEFKESDDGTPKIVEINPKFWGSLDLGIASGLNFPAALLAYADGDRSFDFAFEPRRYSWPLSGDLTHAWRRRESAREVFGDLLSSTTETNLRLDDPAPHVIEALVTLLRPDV